MSALLPAIISKGYSINLILPVASQRIRSRKLLVMYLNVGTTLPPEILIQSSLRKSMICSSLNRFFISNLLSFEIGLQAHLLLSFGGWRTGRVRHSYPTERG